MRVLSIAALVTLLCVSAPAVWAQQPPPHAQPVQTPESGQPANPTEQEERQAAAEEQQRRARQQEESQANVVLAGIAVLVVVVGIGSLVWISFKRSRPNGAPDKPEGAIDTPSQMRSVTENAANAPPTPSAQGSSVPNIFISYRREDSADISGRINDRLVERFGKNAVFKDVDSIPIGRDFRRHLQEAVGRCDALLVIIGKQWCDATDEHGKRRLDDPRDHLRIEIETALERGDIPVIPVLVQERPCRTRNRSRNRSVHWRIETEHPYGETPTLTSIWIA